MKKLSFLLLLPFVVLAFTACETDFDVTASYKEVTVVYGLISQNDTVHYLRINKAFLGDGNALEYAKIADSNSYGKTIEVVVTEVSPANVRKEIIFDTVTIHSIDSGTFYYPDHLMYKAAALLSEKNHYELRIRNSKTGNEVTSGTYLVSDFDVTKPTSGMRAIGFKRSVTTTQKYEWNSGKNGKKYQLILHFYFKEKSDGQDTILRKIDWYFPAQTTSGLNGGEKMSVEYLNEDFYKQCEILIPYADAEKEAQVDGRVADSFDMEFVVIGDDINTYLDVNGSTGSLLSEKAIFTNINNGVGIFSCKYIKHRPAQVTAETKIDLHKASILRFAEPKGK